MMVAIYAPKNTHNITFLDNYTNIFIQDALLRVPGVGVLTDLRMILVCVSG
jgi:HAE1 family hydrophobic/amphiphilic exporter-1